MSLQCTQPKQFFLLHNIFFCKSIVNITEKRNDLIIHTYKLKKKLSA